MDVFNTKREIVEHISKASAHLSSETKYLPVLIAAVQVKDYGAAERNRRKLGVCEKNTQRSQKKFLDLIIKLKKHNAIPGAELPEINKLLEHLRIEHHSRVREMSYNIGSLKADIKRLRSSVETERRSAEAERRGKKPKRKGKDYRPSHELVSEIVTKLHKLKQDIAASFVTYSHINHFVMHKVHASEHLKKAA